MHMSFENYKNIIKKDKNVAIFKGNNIKLGLSIHNSEEAQFIAKNNPHMPVAISSLGTFLLRIAKKI